MATAHPVYEEKLTSLRTEVLFIALSLLFLALLIWRIMAGGFDGIAAGLLFMLVFFIFYALNYRVLVIHILADKLVLRFGIFGWTIPFRSIKAIYVDEASLWRLGGAGIHFSFIGGRYRAIFNFLEHERIVVRLSEKRGPVKEVAFSTGRPGDLMRLLMAAE